MELKRNSEDRVELLASEALTKQNADAEYLMELDVDNLLFPYYFEAGLTGSVNYKKKELYGGWESTTCHIRGTFAGHFLSAAALLCREGDYPVLRAKAEYMVGEIRRCQERNGGQWAFPIPDISAVPSRSISAFPLLTI